MYHRYFNKLLVAAANVIADAKFMEEYPDCFPPEVSRDCFTNDINALNLRIAEWNLQDRPVWDGDYPGDEDETDAEDKDGAL